MKGLLIVLSLAYSATMWAQSGLTLDDFNARQQRLGQHSMLVLGGWSVGNIAVGAVGRARTEGSTRYFHEMNLAWNSVNLAIAGLGYWSTTRQTTSGLSMYETLERHYAHQKILLFNAGLDLAYMGMGTYFMERSRNETDPMEADRWQGYGQSLLLQGGFLLVFDLVQYQLHHRRSPQLRPLLDQSTLSLQGNGLSWQYRF